MPSEKRPLSMIIIGASGDLALRKIFPALFELFCQNLLPKDFHMVGYARSALSNEEFRAKIVPRLSARHISHSESERRIKDFLDRCSYVKGDYDSADCMRQLHAEFERLGADGKENRIFYLSIPPFLFLDVARAAAEADLVHRGEHAGWSRVVVEKPFGSDRESSDELTRNMGQIFKERQTFRIDHYLGKEVIQNLMILRFANLIFDPIWNRRYVHSVRITWMEELGLEGRAGYFDGYGIIRDVMQNHLLQILALVAMEQPVAYEARHVRDEKVKVLRCVAPVTLDDMVVGQYTAGGKGNDHIGYLEEENIPRESITPTFAAATLFVKNRRWDGVPFLIRAGKAMADTKTEIRIKFQEVPGNIFEKSTLHLASNELVIQVQPDAGMSLRIVNKEPGLGLTLNESNLDLRYSSAFHAQIPDAYESLILDVIRGDESLFIRSDELEAAWDIFTPVLHELEERRVRPKGYPFGGNGPEAGHALAARQNLNW